jgi:hypothetical protein
MEKERQEKLDDGQLLLTLMTRDRPDLSSERAPRRDKTTNLRQYLVASPTVGSTSRRTDWPTVSRNVTSASPNLFYVVGYAIMVIILLRLAIFSMGGKMA